MGDAVQQDHSGWWSDELLVVAKEAGCAQLTREQTRLLRCGTMARRRCKALRGDSRSLLRSP